METPTIETERTRSKIPALRPDVVGWHRDRGANWDAYYESGVGRDDVAPLPPFESVEFVAGLVFLMLPALPEVPELPEPEPER